MSAYRDSILEPIRNAQLNYGDLFTSEEHAFMDKMEALPTHKSDFLGRLLQRKYQWIRSNTVEHYFGANVCCGDELVELERDLIVEVLGRTELPLQTMWKAVCEVFNKDEWRILASELKLKLNSGVRTEEIQQAVKAALSKQRTLFSTPESMFRSLVAKVFSRSGVLVFCVRPSLLVLLRRIQRLGQLSSIRVSEMTVSAALQNNVALLVRFKKVIFANYSICRTIPEFPTATHFVMWESALEFHCLMEKISHETLDSTGLASVCAQFQLRQHLDVFRQAANGSTDAVEASALKSIEQLGNMDCIEPASIEPSCYLRCIGMAGALSLSVVDRWRAKQEQLLHPPGYERFKAETILSRCIFIFVELLEKAADYETSINLLQFLLCLRTPAFIHGRYRLFTRLCIDLEHLQCPALAAEVAQMALGDASLPLSERELFNKRIKRLTKAKPKPAALELEHKFNFGSIDDIEATLLKQADALTELMSPQAPTAKSNQSSVASNVSWSCSACTFINVSSASFCAMCVTVRRVASPQKRDDSPEIVVIDDEDEPICIEITEQASSSPAVSGNTGFLALASSIKRVNAMLSDPLSATSMESDSSEVDNDECVMLGLTPAVASTTPYAALLRSCISDGVNVGAYEIEYAPPTLQIIGRRFLTKPSRNMGKSRFFGSSGETLSVEAWVLEQCWKQDVEDESSVSKEDGLDAKLDGLGWEGWHCEGDHLRSLFGLLLWNEIYAPIPNVFLCPYQDLPLDMRSRTFARDRSEMLASRLYWIATAPPKELIEFLGESYRANFGCVSVVNWSLPLRALQAVAVCIGPAPLARFCRAMAASYRQLKSGLPDLLLLRVRMEKRCEGYSEGVVTLDDWVGNWRTYHPAASDDLTSLTETKGADTMIKRQKSYSGSRSTSPRTEFADEVGDSQDVSPTADFVADEAVVMEVNVNATESDLSFPSPPPHGSACMDTDEPVSSVLDSGGYCFTMSCGCEMRCEARCVEVKGPNDRLSTTQTLWLQVLNTAGLPSCVARVVEVD